MAYGKLKVDTLTWDNSGSDTDVTISSLAAKADLASPTFTGTPTVPGYAALSGATFTGDVTFTGDASNGLWDKSANAFVANLTGNVTGNVTGNCSGTALSVTQAAQTAITSVGSLTGLTVSGSAALLGQVAFSSQLKEAVTISAGKLSDAPNLDIEAGNVFYFTVAESTTSTPNLRYNSSTALGTKMAIGDCLSVTIITTANASAYSAQLNIDGGAVVENWTGGSAPSGGGSSGVDIHAYTIIKIAATGTSQNDYKVIANHTKTS